MYALVNFFIFAGLGERNERNAAEEIASDTIRGFSGHWMLFYAAALAMLYSGSNMDRSGTRCPNGHSIEPLAQFCEACDANRK